MNGLPYYKAYPRDFLEGTIGMPFEIKCAYRVVLDLIYMQGGRLPDDARYIAGHLGCSLRKWKAIRAELLERRKLKVSGEFLANYRADKELETLAKLQDKQAENARGARKNKDLEKPWPYHTEPEPEPYNTEAKASDGQAVDLPAPVDQFADEIFTRGVAYLCRKGIPEKNARSFIGKLRKDHADAEIFAAFSECSKAGAVDPIPWITRRLTPEPTFRASDIQIDLTQLNPDGSLKK